jgi:hypothetical protein
MGQPVRSRLRPARRSGLTSPDPVRTPTPARAPPQIPDRRTPDKPQNRQRQRKHAPKAQPKQTIQPKISRWIQAKRPSICSR